MARILRQETLNALTGILERQGGALFFDDPAFTPDIRTWITAVKVPSGYKPFSISIYDTEIEEDVVKLILMINPRDISIGQVHVASNAYTREGWVNTLWGEQQGTIAANGTTAGFYFSTADGRQGGITNFRKKQSQSFLNFLALASIFKNNGYYFLDGEENPNLFKDGLSRVVNVMDTVKIEYDDSTYLGTFSSFVITEDATNPHRIEYNFEFVISSYGIYKRGIEGHVKRNNNHQQRKVQIGIQGSNTNLNESIKINEEELRKFLDQVSEPSPLFHRFSNNEDQEEQQVAGAGKDYVTTAQETMRITRGWRHPEFHKKKMDYRTGSTLIRSFTNGLVWYVTPPTNTYGASNYVLVQSRYKEDIIFLRYYHLDSDSIRAAGIRAGNIVFPGDVLGREGTDHGKYIPHCDFEIRLSPSLSAGYHEARRIDCTPFLDDVIPKFRTKAQLGEAKYRDYKIIQFKNNPNISV